MKKATRIYVDKNIIIPLSQIVKCTKNHEVKNMKKMLCLLTSAMLVIGSVFSSALAYNETTESVPLSTEQETEHLLVNNGIINSMDLPSSSYGNGIEHSISDGIPFSITTNTYEYDDYTNYNISFGNLENIHTENDKLAVADYIFENIFQYTAEEISSMSDEQKIKIAIAPKISFQAINVICFEDGTELILSDQAIDRYLAQTRSVGNDVNDNGTFRCVLSVSTKPNPKKGTASLSVRAEGNLPTMGIGQFSSICGQNVACESENSQTTGYYYYGWTGSTKGTIDLSEQDKDNYESIGGATGGTGVRYEYKIPSPGTNTIVKNAYVNTTVDFSNSSVEDGGRFNVYGNFGIIRVNIGELGVGFPWGISGQVLTNVSEHRTQVTTSF